MVQGPELRCRHRATAWCSLVAEQHAGAPDAEEAVGDEHGALVAEVPVLGDVLSADDNGIAVGVDLQAVQQAN